MVRIDRVHVVVGCRGKMMEFILVVGFGIAGILWLIGLMDWYARKKDRTAGDRGG
jgi:hypothetical protein